MTRSGDPQDAQALLRAASHILAEEGPGKLTVRAIAKRAGVSTMAIYSRFGGKLGIVDGLYREGFARLAEAQQQAEGTTARERLVCMTQAYRRVALHNATHYRVMFGDAVAGFEPSAESRARAWRTFLTLAEALAACMREGSVARGDPERAAHILFAACHGLVSMELAGMPLGEELLARRYEEAVQVVLNGLSGAPDPATPAAPEPTAPGEPEPAA